MKSYIAKDDNDGASLELDYDNFGDGKGWLPDLRIANIDGTNLLYFFNTLEEAKEFHQKFGEMITFCEKKNMEVQHMCLNLPSKE